MNTVQPCLYCGTMALNGMLSMGYRGDWATHNLEHAVSAVYDIPHGGGLAILFPNWMKHVLSSEPGAFQTIGCSCIWSESRREKC